MRKAKRGAARPSEVGRLVRRIVEAGAKLSPSVERAVLGAWEAARGEVLALLDDPELYRRKGPGEGQAPVHAARLAGLAQDERAAGRLARIVVEEGARTPVVEAAAVSLMQLGGAARESCLEAYATVEGDEAAREILARVLAFIGAGDERIVTLLVERFRARPTEREASSLGVLGDARALPVLLAALDSVEDAAPDAAQSAAALALAIRKCGGVLDEARRTRLDRLFAAMDRPTVDAILGGLRAIRPDLAPAAESPCPCGSGRTWGACHGAAAKEKERT